MSNSELTAHAFIKGVKSAPRKVNIVASLVRDRDVADALVILDHTPRRAALQVKKAIESAKSNLIQSASINPKTIRISRILISKGPVLRRYKPASKGRALPFVKASSHIFVEVAGEQKIKAKKQAKKTSTAKKETK